MKAEAVVFTAPNVVEFQPVDCPDPRSGDVVVRVTHSWISNGTEGSYLRGERIAGDTARRPSDERPFPVVPGYQKVGIIEWIGDDVAGMDELSVGDYVFTTISQVDGMFSSWGGHVSPAVTPVDQVWQLPPGLPPEAYAGLVLTQVGYNCGARSPMRPGDGAVVLGDGMVGQWAAQTLAWRGAKVILLGHHPDRMARFPAGPGRHAMDSRDEDLPRAIYQIVGLDAIHVLVDTVGSIEAVERLVRLMDFHGHIVSAGFYGTDDRLALQPLRAGEQTVHLVSGWTTDRMDATLELVRQGHLQTMPLITHHFPVERVATAWDLINAKRDGVLGVILDW